MSQKKSRLEIFLDKVAEGECEIYEPGGFFDPNKFGERIACEEKFLNIFIETFPEAKQTIEKYKDSTTVIVVVRSLMNVLYCGGNFERVCNEFCKNYIDGIISTHNEVCPKKYR